MNRSYDIHRGFITIALGKYFSYLAYNLILSYRLNSSCNIPFVVVTDSAGADLLNGLYDDSIVVDNVSAKGYLHKLDIYEWSPFEQTIFIDADSMIIRDIADWFDIFELSGQDFAVWGRNQSINDPAIQALFQKKRAAVPRETVEKYKLDYLISFNGGVYFFKKSSVAASIFQQAKDLLNTYEEDGLIKFSGNSMGDEPLMQIAMVTHGIKGIPDPDGIRMFCTPGMRNLQIDVLRNKCRFIKVARIVTPAVMHWGTDVTRRNPIYKREAMKLNFNDKHSAVGKRCAAFLCQAVYPFLIFAECCRTAGRFFQRIVR